MCDVCDAHQKFLRESLSDREKYGRIIIFVRGATNDIMDWLDYEQDPPRFELYESPPNATCKALAYCSVIRDEFAGALQSKLDHAMDELIECSNSGSMDHKAVCAAMMDAMLAFADSLHDDDGRQRSAEEARSARMASGANHG